MFYLNLLTSGRLNESLASVDEQAENMFSRLVKEYADGQGVTEQLKAENQLEWVGRMNNIQACVGEGSGRACENLHLIGTVTAE